MYPVQTMENRTCPHEGGHKHLWGSCVSLVGNQRGMKEKMSENVCRGLGEGELKETKMGELCMSGGRAGLSSSIGMSSLAEPWSDRGVKMVHAY